MSLLPTKGDIGVSEAHEPLVEFTLSSATISVWVSQEPPYRPQDGHDDKAGEREQQPQPGVDGNARKSVLERDGDADRRDERADKHAGQRLC